MQAINIFTIFLFAQYSIIMVFGNKPALCDADGIQAEILKAIQLLKTKPGPPLNKTAPLDVGVTDRVVRQDEDDDDDALPYYVPAIAKVIGSVLAQNATSVIEESFGFIPPEVNKNIQFVLSQVLETVQTLKPMPSTTQKPKTTQPPVKVIEDQPDLVTHSGGNITEEEKVAQIEAFLAYALAQEIGASIGANVSSFPRPVHDQINANSEPYANLPLIPLVEESQVTTAPLEVVDSSSSVASVPELFSSTFKYFDVRAVNSDRVSSGGGVAIYAPNYAPNYVEVPTTEKIPMYAPAYDHHSFTVSPKTASPLKLAVTTDKIEESTTESPEEVVTGTAVSTTTDDDDDDDYEDN